MFLCAGLGTRLAPLTEHRPKPLVPLGDRPLLAHLLRRPDGSWRSPILVNAFHMEEQISDILATYPIISQVLHEVVLLGTAGGIRNAKPWLGSEHLLVHNGDILTQLEEEPLVSALGDADLVLAVAPRPVGEGTVGMGEGNTVVRLRGETFGQELWGGDYVGIAALGPRCLQTLPERGCLIGDWALPELRRGHRIGVTIHSHPWIDVGNLEAYHRANMQWLNQNLEPGSSSFRAPSARVSPDVTLSQSIVGQGAEVLGAGPIHRTVIWPGARATAPLSNAVVVGSGLVVAVAPTQ